MNVVRFSIWAPDYQTPKYTPVTLVVPEETITVSIDEFVAQMSDVSDGIFYTYETLETDNDLERATMQAMQKAGESYERERYMAVMYYWTAAVLRSLAPGGVQSQTAPSPFPVDQVKYVLEQLVKHPDYQKSQRLIAISEDSQVIEAHGGKVRIINP